MSKKYIHYGHKKFDRSKFIPVQNFRAFTKPHGGLWASPVDAEFGWKDWCKENEFNMCRMGCSFTFELSPEANVLHICSADSLDGLPRVENEWSLPEWCMLDFEKLIEQGYDAIELILSADYSLYWNLYGWDCDSILIMNPEVIVECTK